MRNIFYIFTPVFTPTTPSHPKNTGTEGKNDVTIFAVADEARSILSEHEHSLMTINVDALILFGFYLNSPISCSVLIYKIQLFSDSHASAFILYQLEALFHLSRTLINTVQSALFADSSNK